MKRRLMVGLLAGGLMAAMLPGVATATPGNIAVFNFGQCKVEGGASGGVGPYTVNENGNHGPFESSKRLSGEWFILLGCNNHKLQQP